MDNADTAPEQRPDPPNLAERIPPGGTDSPDEILDLFLGWVADIGFELYPAQEEALLEIMAGHHVILDTPTGSGKSLVAQGLHFKALCEGRTSFYTSPIKALASEKFFDLCRLFGADNVGMRTGDASINPDGRIICCTQEVLSNLALRLGRDVDAPYVVMDEFHYYSDRDRGVAWQVPLISLPDTVFLLMSATLGDTSRIEEHLRRQTTSEPTVVSSDVRPVPLDFEYRETPLHETVQDLADQGKAPMYIVSFTQRECAELAQNLTSMQLITREERRQIAEACAGFRFATPYGSELRRFLGFGVGVHHAGLLPRYRRLVEQLAQSGLLKAICGTDTLGVGVNIPIRTVLFSKLAKYDGRKVGILRVRDFKQIAGRAGRRGFDDRGSVVCQAPEEVIDKLRAERKAGDNPAKRRKLGKKKGPAKGTVSWTRETFESRQERPPEPLRSQFRVGHGMILDTLQHDAEVDDPEVPNFHTLRSLISRCHEEEGGKAALVRHAAALTRSLYHAGVITMERDRSGSHLWVTPSDSLQHDFSLHHTLSLFLVEALEGLDPESPDYALDLLSLAESVLEDPHVILWRQTDRLKGELLARLKEEGVTYEERVARLDEVQHPQPLADYIQTAFERFRRWHPWVGGADVRPKGVGREMYEGYMAFHEFVRLYGIQRQEGVLLRYLSQLYKTLHQNLPETAKTEAVYDLIGFFRTMLERVDTSLLDEWQSLRHSELVSEDEGRQDQVRTNLVLTQLLGNPTAFAARVRAEMHQLVRALSARDWEEAEACTRMDPDDPEGPWTAIRFEAALAPFFDEHSELPTPPERTCGASRGPSTWEAPPTWRARS